MKLKWIFGCVLLGCFSCKEAEPLENALEQARENRKELFTVLEHYSKSPADSLKLKAAKFLITYMPGHYTLNCPGINRMRQHLQVSDTLVTAKATINYWWKATETKNTDYQALPDLQTVKAAFLIENIDKAFHAWQTAPWQSVVSFDDFCNYILPYRLADEGLADGWRDSLYKQYAPIIQGVTDIQKAFVLLRDTIWTRTQRENPKFEHATDVLAMRQQGIMTCMQGCVYLGAVARALGMPVVCDHVLQWANYSNQGHSWVALTYGSHTYTVVDGNTLAREYNQIDAAEFPKHCQLESNYPLDATLKKRAAKVWRFAYRQTALPVDKKLTRLLPFGRACAEDVSTQYGFRGEVTLPVEENDRAVCLCIYSSGNDWLPVDCVMPEGGRAVFHHMGDSIVYQAMTFAGDSLQPIGHPFLLLPNGQHDLIPDRQQTQTLELTRKYPFSHHWTNQWGQMKGNYFEASNDSTFHNSDRLYTFQNTPVFRNEIILPARKSYRYIRYVSVPKCSIPITELAFYKEDNLLQGRTFGTKMEAPKRAFDENTSTLIYSQKPGYSVGIDFGSPQPVDRIVLFPKNDGNFVIPGQIFELYYYDQGWHSINQQTSTGFSVSFSHVPTHALLLLKNLTSGKEERIFTYKQGCLSWW